MTSDTTAGPIDSADGVWEKTFPRDLAQILNRHSAENGSNTPDLVLADYLVACLNAFDQAVQSRAVWYGRHDSISYQPRQDGRAQADAPRLNHRLVRTVYRSIRGDGTVWCESSDPADPVLRTGGHTDLTFQRLDIYQTDEGWKSWTPEEKVDRG